MEQVTVKDNWLNNVHTPKSTGESGLINEKNRFSVIVKKDWVGDKVLQDYLKDGDYGSHGISGPHHKKNIKSESTLENSFGATEKRRKKTP